MAIDLCISGGTIVTDGLIIEADLYISGGVVVGMGHGLPVEVKETIDATGKMVLPGFIDLDCQCDLGAAGALDADTLKTVTRAGMEGGITTACLDYPANLPVGNVATTYATNSHQNVMLRAALTNPANIKQGVEAVRMAQSAGLRGTLRRIGSLAPLTQANLSEILQSLAGAGPVFLFPQDGPLGEFEQAQAIAASKQTGASGQDIRDAMHPHYLADVGLRLMGAVSCLGRDPRLVAMPVTTSQEIAALAEIREMPRQNILAVAAMPYLVLGREDRSGAPPKGRLPAGYPPIRSQTDRLSLWQAAEAGLIDAIASGGAQDGDDVLGNPALFFSSLYGMGVIGRRIDLTTLITLLCDNPAKIMGVYPHKGSLQIGSDADVVIFDPNAKLDDLADDSPFKDINRRGKIHSVILNGKLGYSTENPVEEAPKGIIVSPEPVSLTK